MQTFSVELQTAALKLDEARHDWSVATALLHKEKDARKRVDLTIKESIAENLCIDARAAFDRELAAYFAKCRA